MRPRLSLALSMLGLILIAAVSASPPVVPSPHPAASVGASVSKTVVASPTLAPGATMQASDVQPSKSPRGMAGMTSPTPAPSRYAPLPNTIVTTCKPAPEPDTPPQIYLASILTPSEYCWAYWIVRHESSWRMDEFDDPPDGACGLPQAKPCAKMADTVPDWRQNYEGQLRWMAWWVLVAMAPDATHPAYTEGGTRYGSFAEAACFEFGCRTADGALWDSNGWY